MLADFHAPQPTAPVNRDQASRSMVVASSFATVARGPARAGATTRGPAWTGRPVAVGVRRRGELAWPQGVPFGSPTPSLYSVNTTSRAGISDSRFEPMGGN